MPSITRCERSRSTSRSLKVPGSLSSALQMTYLGVAGSFATRVHFFPVGNPAPPIPLRPEATIVSERAGRSLLMAARSVPWRSAGSRSTSASPQSGLSRTSGSGLRPSTIATTFSGSVVETTSWPTNATGRAVTATDARNFADLHVIAARQSHVQPLGSFAAPRHRTREVAAHRHLDALRGGASKVRVEGREALQPVQRHVQPLGERAELGLAQPTISLLEERQFVNERAHSTISPSGILPQDARAADTRPPSPIKTLFYKCFPKVTDSARGRSRRAWIRSQRASAIPPPRRP